MNKSFKYKIFNCINSDAISAYNMKIIYFIMYVTWLKTTYVSTFIVRIIEYCCQNCVYCKLL